MQKSFNYDLFLYEITAKIFFTKKLEQFDNAQQIKAIERENVLLKKKINDMQEYEKIFDVLNARYQIKAFVNVVFIKNTYYNSYLIANFKGEVAKNDIVINKAGLFVGRVVDIKNNTVKIQLLNDKIANIPVSSDGIVGIANGSNNDNCNITFNSLKNNNCPANGSVVMTYGYNSFPINNVPVGTINNVNGKCCINNTSINDINNLVIIKTITNI